MSAWSGNNNGAILNAERCRTLLSNFPAVECLAIEDTNPAVGRRTLIKLIHKPSATRAANKRIEVVRIIQGIR